MSKVKKSKDKDADTPRTRKKATRDELASADGPKTGDLHCAPCGRENRTVDSTKFCDDCNEHLCERCVHDHKKFLVTKSHTISEFKKKHLFTDNEKSSMSGGTKTLVTEKCTHHGGKVLELFCGDHDELCCGVCVAVGHRVCKDVRPITEAAVGIESSLELLQEHVKQDLHQMKTNIDNLKSHREEDQQNIQQQKQEIINAILDMRIRVTDILDNLERTARNELQTRYEGATKRIDSDVKTCEDVSAALDNLDNKAESVTNDEPELFATVKKAKKTIAEGRAVVESITPILGKERLLFMPGRTLENVLGVMKSLVEFGEETHEYTAQFDGEFSFGLSSDPGSSEDNTGSAFLPDGKVLLTNTHHKRLKLLSPTYRVIDHLDLPEKPYDVCLAGPVEAITSLREEKTLQFFTLDKKLRLSRIIKIGISCYGVRSHGGEIFVACIGGQYENRPQLRVYNMSGRMLRVVERDEANLFVFSSPRNITVSPDGTILHVTDRERGVIRLGVTGNVISVFRSEILDSPRGITVDPQGNVFVCGQNSHNVAQLNVSGELVTMVIQDRARMTKPQSLCYIQRGHRSFLLITFQKSKFIKVYTLA